MSVHIPTQSTASAYRMGLRDGAKQSAAEIARLRTERDEAVAALEEIDAIGADHGHWEAAARTAQEIARRALKDMEE